MSTYAIWITEKRELADALNQGLCGGSFADGVIILCTCICAMASRLWIETKQRKDRKRFVEIVTRFSNSPHDTKKISIPLLTQENADWAQRLPVSDIAFRYTEANDKEESEIVALCTALPPDYRRTIRRYSYANILYRDVRSGFAHTYMPTDSAASADPLRGIFDRGAEGITYVNRLQQKNMRQINFSLEWIAAVAHNIANAMDAECARNNKHIGENVGLTPPSTWWIDGA